MPKQEERRVPVVLIVEDEVFIAEALAFMVEDAGYVVRLAPHGHAALAAILADRPDLVISDLMMPRMTGAELLQAVRAQGDTTLPIVLMSAAGRSHVANLGADAALGKPFELAEVEALLHRFLE